MPEPAAAKKANATDGDAVGGLPYAGPTPPVVHVIPAPEIQLLEPEPRWKRLVYGILAFALAVGFFFVAASYWVPAHAGEDQNGYLVGGRMIAENLTMREAPVRPGTRDEFDPHQFVGRMWVGAGEGTPDERYYPKYPIGLPALYAAALWIGAIFGDGWGPWLAYWVSPIAMALAVWATYLVGRRFAGSFGGLLAAIVFATSPVTLELATNPNSHAACVCCVTWGMYLLIRWWQKRGLWRAIAAGLLLGYAATIRYSEGTLILPIGLVALYAVRWRDWRSPVRNRLAQALALLCAWAVPVGLLVLYNHFAIGATTGYDPTNESTGFSWSYAAVNWETMLRQINTTGLAQLFPLALAGLVWMFWWNWRAATVMATWILPCLLIYTFYYWAPDGTNISYLRFFTTILPALAICFFWLISRLNAWAIRNDAGITHPAVTAAVVTAAGLLGLVIVGAALQHAWLWEHDPAAVGLSRTSWIMRHLTPTGATDLDPGSRHDAIVGLQSAGLGAIAAGAAAALIALALARGRAAVPSVGAGLFVGVVVAMHLTNALPQMEMDQLGRIQLQQKAMAIRGAAPEGSVILCQDPAMLRQLQFLGDYALYDGQSFRRDYVQQLPDMDPDQPQGLDPGRRDALYKRLKDFDQKALDEQGRKIISDALKANRRVFFVVNRQKNDPLPRSVRKALGLPVPGKEKVRPPWDLVQRLCTPDRFDIDVAAVWPGYVPRVFVPQANVPRGQKFDRPPDLQAARQAVQLIEATQHVATPVNVPPKR